MSVLLLGILAVVLLNVYAIVLILLRSRVYGVGLYRPMLLNIALSFLPVLLAIVLGVGLLLLAPVFGRLAQLVASGGVILVWSYLVVATLVWLVFFPNSVYLITELNFSHRGEDTPVPLWYDIVQTLALTLSGIANAVLSLAVVQTMFIVLVDLPGAAIPSSSWVAAGAIIVLGAIGVYLGRYLRLNSWDVRHPASLLWKLTTHLRQPGKALEAFGFVLTHALLIALLYVPLFVLGWSAVRAGAL
ncbi:DUF1361 domain-containing protein [Microbacterium dextranolyticum]|uniref:DUF1361 domain-containing protein n=1 Tax=Microbacterium dextranolyticum TaxID=36806 RepID=A0A9W6HN96_9MICO|nr:DUF1361 domain-containing protein [Microbacterium dextranolyticum]MBM7463033.1 putative membrane protein [Microbacterium dextranolyticum]GLJ95861.1 hypothetical protein GCM10017591_19240 [Microbacterium dextranolyticum]